MRIRRPHVAVPTRLRSRGRLACAVAVGALAIASFLAAGSNAASSSITVTMNVPSAVELDTGGCPPAARSFGSVLPGSSAVSGLCTMTFGSSNDSSRLMMFQPDGTGDAMASLSSGAYDNAFDSDGRQTVEFPEGGAQAKFVVQQSDGSYIMGGSVVNGGGNPDMALAKLTPAGALDTTYGAALTGRVVTTIVPTEMDQLWSAVLQPDGKLVAIGMYWVNGLNNDCMVLRYTTAGVLDTTFGGGDGHVEYDGSGWDDCRGITQLRDGRFMTSGSAWDGSGVDTVIARINQDGTMDPSFDGDGIKRIDMSGGTFNDIAYSIREVDGKKFVISGDRGDGTYTDTFVARFNLDGTADATYGTGGSTNLQWNATSNAFAGPMDLDAAGNGFVAMRTDVTGDTDMYVAKVLANGQLDTTWGTGGKQRNIVAGRGNPGYGLLSQGDRVLIVGADSGTSPDSNWSIARFTSTGLDPTFNGGTPLNYDWNSQWDFAGPTIRARDGRVGIAGTVGKAGGGKDLMGMMLLAGGATIPDYGGAAVWGSGATQSLFGACLESRAGAGVTGGWTVDPGGSCTAVVSDPWVQIEDANTSAAKVLGSPTVGLTTASASVRFGVKVGTTTAPGAYVAPIALEVLAPNA